MRLPDVGLTPDTVRDEVAARAVDDVDWRSGRGWSLVYDAPVWHSDLVDEVAARFNHENGLSHSAFPSAARFESEVIAMASSVVAPGATSYGLFTSGGTESLMVAVKAYRDASGRGREAGRDELVLPVTAHPGYWKAADYLGLRLRLAPVGPDGRPDPEQLLALVGPRTALVGLSAPCFPFGVVDPVEEVAGRAAELGVGVHVDAALGGLFLPFLDGPPRFGLDVEGVTSVSLDLHKYGYGAKGASVVLFGDPELRHGSYFVSTGWPGGAYAAPGVLGTRPVGPAAAAWAAMVALGTEGYRCLVAQVMATTRHLQDGIAERTGLRVLGKPPMGVFAMADPGTSVPALAAGLEKRGWRVDVQDDPPAMHFIVFPRHERVADRFLADLADAAAGARTSGGDATSSSYGVMVRGGRITDDVLREHLDQRFDLASPP